MKKIIILFCFPVLLFSQTNEEIANIYIKRAKKSFNEQNISEAEKSYTKALKYIDLKTNDDISICKFGMILFVKANNYAKAKECSKDYFRLETDKKTEEYANMLELYVDIMDRLEEQENIENTQVKQASSKVDNSNHYNFDNIVKSIKKKKD